MHQRQQASSNQHTHATILLADGENATVVQARLGHHSHSFTADTYQHVMPGTDEAASSRFEGLVFGRRDETKQGDQDDEDEGMPPASRRA